MLTSSSQTTPAVPIGMKKAQENVSGAMGEAPGAHGPIVESKPEQKPEKLIKPKKKLPLKYIIAGIILLLVIIGGGAAYYLSTISQDVRQRATGCTYWSGGAAAEGACDNRGGIMQECKGGYWSAPSAGKCGTTSTGTGTGTGVVTPACANDLESCESTPCCGTSVCQGQEGSRVCQNSGLTAEQLCPGGTCTGYYSFQCGSLSVGAATSGQPACNENGQFHGTDQGGAQSRASATGCGQWDQVCVGGSNDGQLCGGFSIINESCGGGGGGEVVITQQPEPSPSPEVVPSPSPSPEVSPSPSPSASPEASPSPSALPVGCGEPCSVSTDCAESNHICYEYADDGNPDGGICRLINNPTSETCVEPSPSPSPTPTVGCNDACATNSDCRDTDHVCNSSTNTCRLAENPGDANCAPAPEPTPTPAPGCNDTCYASSECSFSGAVCYDNLCRLATNPTNTACQAKTTAGTFYQQPSLPQQLPQSGSEDILNWLKVGLGALGLGLIFLFL